MLLDGYLARSRNEVSRLGTLLDPLADKLMMAAAFIALTIAGKVPLWLPIVLIGKEVAPDYRSCVFLCIEGRGGQCQCFW